MVAGCFRLSDWSLAMEHGEPGQVGNQAALSRPFYVLNFFPADDFFRVCRVEICEKRCSISSFDVLHHLFVCLFRFRTKGTQECPVIQTLS